LPKTYKSSLGIANNALTAICDNIEITILAMDDLVAQIPNAIGYEGGANMMGRGFGDAPLIMVKRPHPGVTNL